MAIEKRPAKVHPHIEELKALAAIYQRAFGTPEGRRVLEDLKTRFYDGPMSGPDVNREVGRRDVLHHILKMRDPKWITRATGKAS